MKINVTIRFYEELNDFLKIGSRKQDLPVDIDKDLSVGALIESLGPSCSQVDLILVNGQSTGFDHELQHNDRISVYPVFERLNIESVSCLESSPLRKLKFICDVHLGRLAKYLRMLGFDTLYENDYDDNIIIRLSNIDDRILLTRNKKLLFNPKITRRYLVTQTNGGEQVREVLEFFDLKNSITPMSRCLKCNGSVRPVSKKAVQRRVDETILAINDLFTECAGCGKLYWKGSHFASMMKWIREMADGKQ